MAAASPIQLGFRASDAYRVATRDAIINILIVLGFDDEADDTASSIANRALDAWIARGLPSRQSEDGFHFDPVEVINFGKAIGMQGADTFFHAHIVPSTRAKAAGLNGLHAGAGGREFSVSLVRTFNTSAAALGANLRLRMPLPLEGPQLRHLDVKNLFEDGEARISRGRLEVRRRAGPEQTASIGAEVTFTAYAQDSEVTEPNVLSNRDIYLKPRDGLIAVSERIVRLASALAAGASAPIEAIRAFWNYLLDNLYIGGMHYDQLDLEAPCDSALDSGWADCQLAAAVFASLCRARSIPCRIVGGHFLYPSMATNHFWAEAWIDGRGWTPFDFLTWDLSGGGRDAAWRDYFFGRIDCRLATQCLPLDFTGSAGVTLPQAWHITLRRLENGTEIRFCDALSGEMVYLDQVMVS